MWKLVDKKSGRPIAIGSLRSTHDHVVVKVLEFQPPHREGTTGKVYIEHRDGFKQFYYASVLDAKFVEVEGHDAKKGE